MDSVFVVQSKNLLLNPESPRFSPVLSSKSFIVLYFTFRSVSHFELIFVKCVSSVSHHLFGCRCYCVDVTVSLFKRPSFLHWVIFVPLSRDQLIVLCWPIFGLSILFH